MSPLAIQAPNETPSVHPHDKALLRPLASLSRSKTGDQPVSFLRRTEYISSTIRRSGAGALINKDNLRRPEKRPAPEPDDSPANIRRKIDHGFEVAEKYLNDPSKLKHPLKKNAKVVDVFPILPDLDSFPDAGAYVTVKFLNAPVHSGTSYDTRLLSGLFKPCDRTPAEDAAYAEAMEMWERDPTNHSKPAPCTNYDYYLTKTAEDAQRFRAKFDIDNPENGEEELYTAQGESGPCFQFDRLRAYETVKETELDHKTKYSHELIIGYSDGDIEGQKAAWYYPVMQRSTIRPQRQKRIDLTRGLEADDGQTVVDQLEVTVEDPSDELREHALKYKEHPHGWDEEEEDGEQERANGAEKTNGGAGGERRRDNSSPVRNGGSHSDEEDAEGDEDE